MFFPSYLATKCFLYWMVVFLRLFQGLSTHEILRVSYFWYCHLQKHDNISHSVTTSLTSRWEANTCQFAWTKMSPPWWQVLGPLLLQCVQTVVTKEHRAHTHIPAVKDFLFFVALSFVCLCCFLIIPNVMSFGHFLQNPSYRSRTIGIFLFTLTYMTSKSVSGIDR